MCTYVCVGIVQFDRKIEIFQEARRPKSFQYNLGCHKSREKIKTHQEISIVFGTVFFLLLVKRSELPLLYDSLFINNSSV